MRLLQNLKVERDIKGRRETANYIERTARFQNMISRIENRTLVPPMPVNFLV